MPQHPPPFFNHPHRPVPPQPGAGPDHSGATAQPRRPLWNPSERRKAGHALEASVEAWLVRQGLVAVARNVTFKLGELDLVMRDGPSLVFVEVRSRTLAHFGSALESIDPAKQRRLIRAATLYLQRHHPQPPPCRFDVVTLDGGVLDWVKNALPGW